MNKRLRSRVFAAAIASSTFFGISTLNSRFAFGQDRPSAAALLDRGAKLYDQKQYADAKKILLDIEPAQLPEDQRPKLAELLKNTDLELAKSQGSNSAFDTAQAAMDGDKLADAAAGFQGIIDDSAASGDVKDKAKIQLALVREKQAAKAPQMKELLAQAQSLYDQGKLDEAQNALTTVVATGSDLGWQDNAKPAALQQKIADRRAAIAHNDAATPPSVVTAGTAPVAPSDPMVTVAPAGAGPAVVTTPEVGPPAIAVEPTPAAPSDDTSSPLAQRIAIDKIERDRAMTQYDLAIKSSNDALVANNYPVAIQRAKEAETIITQYRERFSETEGNALLASATKQEQLATAQSDAWNARQKILVDIDTKKANDLQVLNRAAAKKQRIDQLMKDADAYVKAQQFTSAAEILRTIHVIDPQNAPAELMLTLVEQRIADKIYDSYKKREVRDTTRQEVDDEEEIIPYADLLVYPEDWVNLTRNRIGDQSNPDTALNRAARERLDATLKEQISGDNSLEKIINFLRDSSGTNMIVNWPALGAVGFERNTPVSITLQDVSFRKALNTILSQVGGVDPVNGLPVLGFTIDEGVITISTTDDLNSEKYEVRRVYDIRDLLVAPIPFTAPQLGLGQIQQSSGGGGGGGGLFNDTSGGGGAGGGPVPGAITATDIQNQIETNIAPTTWHDKGSKSIAATSIFNQQMIVTQTYENQAAVYDLLQQLRETNSLQISIESRFLLVQNDFLDDFGLGWNLTIPAGLIGGNVGAVTIANGTDSLAVPQDTKVPGSLAATSISTPSLGLSGTILDNWQLSLLLQATQIDKRTINLTAPRLTLVNGDQYGYIGVTQQFSYISNFNQTVTAGSGFVGGTTGTQLTVSQLTFGVQLKIAATATADRRYVTMNIDPSLVTLDGIDTFGALPNANGNGGAIFGGVFIQLPRLSSTVVHTMVTVPDGGTLLIGGQKLVGESEIEAGVPVLSKIPGLNRLFTNRSMAKDERTLLILVRPKIIIQKEIENALYGPGYDRPTGLPGTPEQGGLPLTGSNGVDPGFSRGE